MRLYPDPILRHTAVPVTNLSKSVRGVLRGMARIMHNREGIGLAAPQIGILQRGHILAQWKSASPFRTILTIVLLLFLFAMLTGNVGPPEWDWVRGTVLFVTPLALFVVITVPDHFLEAHLWTHVARKHVPRIFLWTLGTLVVLEVLVTQVNLEGLIRENL